MIRSSAIISFAVSLLLWSGQVLSSEPQAANTQGGEGAANSAVVCPTPDCQHTACPVPCPTHGRHCPRLVHRHAAGQPCPLPHGLGQRLGRGDGRPCPLLTPQPIPMMPPPSGGFFGALGMPRQYQYDQPYMYPQAMPSAYPVPAPAGQDYPNYVAPPANERIVYIPYAMPPPITVERLAKALPIPKPMRKILGDANMYEYPEMPLHLYTTRGPRDFLAPNPPGIGE